MEGQLLSLLSGEFGIENLSLTEFAKLLALLQRQLPQMTTVP